MVSSKILGHISEGLYRGPSGVLKELVSNAFDANAKTVWISTGRPTFDVVSVRDDGDGMTLEKFIEVVSGRIGDSDKRWKNYTMTNNREVIGRLGIGILGVSQISHEFSIVSHARETESAFQASVEMKDFRKELLDRGVGPSLSMDRHGRPGLQSQSVGTYRVEEIPFDPKKVGLMITATEPTQGFRRQLSEDKPNPLPRDFRTFGQTTRSKDVLATGPWYDRMVWQVASLVPIPYMSAATVAHGDDGMISIAKRLEEYNFSVIVDGVKLFKPVLLDGPAREVKVGTVGEGEGPFHFSLNLDERVWGTDVKVTGYIYGSAGAALHPDAIRGVLIRLKHVGIGEYDKSLLDYRYAEGPRFSWLTGELFVEQGLEDALTVGRDGFDAAHPHYIAIRTWLHDQLRIRIFPTLYRGITSRRLRRESFRHDTRESAFVESISEFAGMRLEVLETNEQDAPPARIDLKRGTAIINSAATWPRGKRQRETAQRLSIIFELVRIMGSNRESVHDFMDLTRDLLSQR